MSSSEVANQALANIDTCVPFTQGMPIPQFRDNRNGIQTRVSGQSRRNHFQCICVCLEAVRLHNFSRV